jgi:hypothetical protein
MFDDYDIPSYIWLCLILWESCLKNVWCFFQLGKSCHVWFILIPSHMTQVL